MEETEQTTHEHRKEDLWMRLYGLLALFVGLGLVVFTTWLLDGVDDASELLLLPGVVGVALLVYGPWLVLCGAVRDRHGGLVPWKHKANLWMAGLSAYCGFCFAGVWSWRLEFGWSWQRSLLPGMLTVGAVFVLLYFVLRQDKSE